MRSEYSPPAVATRAAAKRAGAAATTRAIPFSTLARKRTNCRVTFTRASTIFGTVAPSVGCDPARAGSMSVTSASTAVSCTSAVELMSETTA